ncbi:hypothetical protein LEP1GSC077_3327 [Leptospira interrogans str. C10069]|nr:hypothetical protein LEP1GSC077_3327 [Leptospira interrogans str. C10069]
MSILYKNEDLSPLFLKEILQDPFGIHSKEFLKVLVVLSLRLIKPENTICKMAATACLQ